MYIPEDSVDPREIITEDAFHVDPKLLGTALARPWRRAAAMAVDGICIALLSNATGFLFGLAAALVLFRVAARSASGGFVRRALGFTSRLGGAVVVFVVALSTWSAVSDLFTDEDEPDVASTSASVQASDVEGLRMIGPAIALQTASTEADAHAALGELAEGLRAQGLDDEEIGEALTSAAEGTNPTVTAAAGSFARSLVEPAPAREAATPDLLLSAYAQALSSADSATTDSLRPLLTRAMAADTVAALQREIARGQQENERLLISLGEVGDALDEDDIGIFAMLRSLADDLGLGFGWAGLYFTAFLALWRGQTPGKRLLGIRVLRLDGKPVGWWASFQRFGGYAASIATGLLGFAQIKWDRNRQGVHDKIAETVVTRV